MKISPVDNMAAIISSAQAIKNIQAQMLRHEIKQQLEKNYDRTVEQQLNRRHNELMLDQMYFERAIQQAKLIKGTNVDLYI
jgi:hypothetical protein